MTNTTPEPLYTPSEVKRIKNRFVASLPFYVAVPVLLALLFALAGNSPMDWSAFGLGVLGWIVALLLRGPVAAMVMKLPQSAGQTIVVASSGVLEEGVRLGLLSLTLAAPLAASAASADSVPWVLSIGQGWAAIEVVYTIVSGFATIALLGRTDDKAKQAQAIIASQGTDRLHPMWGAAERLFASLFHIGATLLIAYEPWLAAILIPVHSLLNLSALWLMKRSIVAAECLVAAVGTIVMAAGWLIV